MKKILAAMIVVVTLAGGYVLAAHLSGGAFPVPLLQVGGERGMLRRTVVHFFEDIQFKDFKAAARYHAPELQASVDIPYLIQRLFQVKPEALDIMTYEVVMVDRDTSGNRARVKARVKIKDLVQGNIRDQEMMFYFDRKDEKSPWYMKLEDSLRDPEKEAGKKG